MKTDIFAPPNSLFEDEHGNIFMKCQVDKHVYKLINLGTGNRWRDNQEFDDNGLPIKIDESDPDFKPVDITR